ncbi:hypothetical protein QFC21_000560 [Naganishia friedmannii]|uniref:Uncharacterized protein n=1 Tax=Naganishia friedmannii TaxID=89922 RepID=A0ACC2WDU2_9TREE|nr:hypothetical protein QFC21_000560 [Naganishia friedmannii]
MTAPSTVPQVGPELTVYEMTNEEAYRAVKWALDAGYRHIDTAEWYENEHACGRAISDWLEDHPLTTREEIFYTTKLKTNVSRLDTVDKIKKSLKTSTLSYIDLYLLHSPIGGKRVREECWKGCMDAKEYGWVKSIGVSNYGVAHIQEFIDARAATAAESGNGAIRKPELPVLSQIDLHPFMRRPAIVDICEKNDILLEQVTRPGFTQMEYPTRTSATSLAPLSSFTESYAEATQSDLIHQKFIAIPKSVSQARIEANAQIFDFELDEEDMKQLDALDEYLVTDWDVVDEP